MAKKKSGEEEFELVPESKFHELEAKVNYISKSPFVSTPGVEKMSAQLEGTQDSILSLLEILKQIADANKFDESEKHLIKKEVHPLAKEVKDLKEQFTIMTETMASLAQKVDNLQSDFSSHYLHASQNPNPNLPPLQGGPTPPDQFETNGNENNSMMPPPLDNSGQQLPGLGGKPVEGLPPLEKPKKKGLFKWTFRKI